MGVFIMYTFPRRIEVRVISNIYLFVHHVSIRKAKITKNAKTQLGNDLHASDLLRMCSQKKKQKTKQNRKGDGEVGLQDGEEARQWR